MILHEKWSFMMPNIKVAYVLFVGSFTVSPVVAYEAGDMFLRVGATMVAPDESSDPLALDGVILTLGGGTTGLEVDSNTQLGLTFTYMFNKNWGLELLAATPFEHTASATGALEGVLGDVADIKHLPPTLSAVYYFNDQSVFRPYLGAGINYTVFFEEDITSGADSVLSSLGLTGGDVELDNSWGLSFQVGADYVINKKWHVNASVRWIDIDTEATIKFDNGSKITSDIEIDPYVYTLSMGYIF